MPDEITGMAVICEYTIRPVDICNFCQPPPLALSCQYSSYLGRRVFCDIPEINSQINNELTGAFLNR